MDKYGVQLGEKVKVAEEIGVKPLCPTCRSELDSVDPPHCPVCGTEPWEDKKGK
jgi:predicted amidophosphoribosyltransferase